MSGKLAALTCSIVDAMIDYCEENWITPEALKFLGYRLSVAHSTPLMAYLAHISWLDSSRSFQWAIAEEELVGGDIRKATSLSMASTLNAVGELHHFKLAQKFPRAIERVSVDYSVEDVSRVVTIYFKNGHTLTEREDRCFTDDFYATCAMIYDLPAR